MISFFFFLPTNQPGNKQKKKTKKACHKNIQVLQIPRGQTCTMGTQSLDKCRGNDKYFHNLLHKRNKETENVIRVKKTNRTTSHADLHSTENRVCLNAHIRYFFRLSEAQILDLQDVSYLGEVALGISLNCSFISKKYAFEHIPAIRFTQFVNKVLRLFVGGGGNKKILSFINAKVKISTDTFTRRMASTIYFIE